MLNVASSWVLLHFLLSFFPSIFNLSKNTEAGKVLFQVKQKEEKQETEKTEQPRATLNLCPRPDPSRDSLGKEAHRGNQIWSRV